MAASYGRGTLRALIEQALIDISKELKTMNERENAMATHSEAKDDRDHILHAFQAYVESDLEAAEVSYVKDMLRDTCGLNDIELKRYGFGWVLDDEEAERLSDASGLSDDMIS